MTCIRALTPEERAGIAALFSRLSSESRYRRFLGPKRELTDRELVFFTDIDHVSHEALAAVDQRDCSVVGVARYVQYIDRPRVATVAFDFNAARAGARDSGFPIVLERTASLFRCP